MIYAALIAAAVSAIGMAISAGQNAQAAAIRQKLAQQIQDIPLPVLDKLIAQKLPPEAADRYTQITQAKQSQSDVLGKYMDEVNAHGETADDRAAYLRMQEQAGGIANGAQGAVQRSMAIRGLSGSGMDFALQQQGAQGAMNAANSSGVKEAADARGRYMDALNHAGSMSGQMRGQDAADLHAQDAINEFNARQQSDADIRNQQLPQQNFDNAMGKQTAVANAQNNVAAGYERGAAATRQTAGGIGQSAITAGATVDQYGRSAGASNAGKPGYDANGNPIDTDPSGGEW